MSLRENARALVKRSVSREVITDEFVDKLRLIASDLPDGVDIYKLLYKYYYPNGQKRLGNIMEPGLVDWVNAFAHLEPPEKSALESCLSTVNRQGISKVGDLRKKDVGELMDVDGIGPLRAVFIKALFPTPKD